MTDVNKDFVRFENYSDRASRIFAKVNPHIIEVIGERFKILQPPENLANLLKRYSFKENVKRSHSDTKLVETIKNNFEINITVLGKENVIQINELHTTGGYKEEGLSYSHQNGILKVEFQNVLNHPTVLFEVEGVYPDGIVVTSHFLALHEDDDIEKLMEMYSHMDDLCQKASRATRRIEVCGMDTSYINLPPTSWSHWDDLFLSDSVKAKVKDDLFFFINNRELFKEVGLPWRRGFLLAGPPGNGKTSICRTVASSMDFAAYSFDFSDREVTNADLTVAFMKASRNSPSVFFLEDIDRIYDPDKSQQTNITMDHLLNCLDGLVVNDGLVVIATANNPEHLDPAIRSRPGRFDQVVFIDNPDESLRRSYLKHIFRKVSISDEMLELAVKKTNKMSMSHLKEVFIVSTTKAIGRSSKNISMSDMEDTLEQLVSQFNKNSKEGRKAGF